MRAEDLVSRMTLEEKVSQMVHEAPAIPRLGVPGYNWWNECLHGVGRAGVATVFPQAIGLAATLDHGPACSAWPRPSPTRRGPSTTRPLARGQAATSYQGLTYWTPNINIFRDPRWGRGQETYGEDPYLTGRMGVAVREGAAGRRPAVPEAGVATPKHYAVHSGPEPLRHRFDARVERAGPAARPTSPRSRRA